MKNSNNDVEKLLEFLNFHQAGIVIYGTGEAGRLIWDCVSNCLNSRVLFFIDRDNKENQCCGLPIYDLGAVSPDAGVVIAADPSYGIEERLEKAGISEWIYIDPVILYFYCHVENYFENNAAVILQNKEKINKTRALLCDDLSTRIFEEVLSQRTEPILKNIIQYYDKGQYFGNDIIPKINGNIVDCGAFTGDTLTRYLAQSDGEDGRYYAFEGDASNCEQIQKIIKQKNISDHVNVYNIAVWDEKTTLTFKNLTLTNEATSGRINKTQSEGIKVRADSLDHMLLPDGSVDKIDLITMDIEGAELNALEGARGIIKEYKPMLAISIYHETEHLWEVPLLIHEINPDYNLHIRHHRWNIADTVCYAI